MATPIVVVAAGGLPVVEAINGLGVPVTVTSNGYGRAVTIATNGYGMPVVPSAPFVDTGAPAIVLAPIASVLGGDPAVVGNTLDVHSGLVDALAHRLRLSMVQDDVTWLTG